MLVPISPQEPSPLLRQLLRRGQNSQQGLTIMECLVAIMLIGLTISMVTPPLLIATASRVQTRRGEQAQQLAQDEVDRINTMVQRGLHQSSLLPPDAANPAGLKSVPIPTAFAAVLKTTSTTCSTPRYSEQIPIPVNQVLPVDVDGDCNPDFFMQVFRNGSLYTTAEQLKVDATKRKPARFDLGVRVYSSLVSTNGTLASGRLKTEPASLGLTIGQGQQATNPLSVIYKGISWGERSEVLCQYATQANRAQLSGCN